MGYRTVTVQQVLERRLVNREELSGALAGLVEDSPPLQLLEGPWEFLTMADQVRLALDHIEVMVQPFGAGLAWSTFLPLGSYVIELQDDGIASANFVSCFAPRLPGSLGIAASNKRDSAQEGAEVNPWWPPSNPR